MMSLEEIEEMTSICEQYCRNCPHPQRKTESNCYFSRSVCWSAALYAAGYRKADEVRKEILEEVGDIYICLDEDNEELYARDFGWYKYYVKKIRRGD